MSERNGDRARFQRERRRKLRRRERIQRFFKTEPGVNPKPAAPAEKRSRP
jgi:hypothetical protein